MTAQEYVLKCDSHPKTNGLGKTQRAIIEYLATAPAGFKCRGCGHPECAHPQSYHDAANAYTYDGGQDELLWHGPPHFVRLDCITRAVYATEQPTAAQTRIVQRNVRRLEQLGLAECKHGTARYIERPYTTWSGKPAVMDQAVHALFVALVWDCEHLREQDRLVAEWDAARERRVDELIMQMFGRPPKERIS